MHGNARNKSQLPRHSQANDSEYYWPQLEGELFDRRSVERDLT